jgi:spermidine synthase
MFQPVDAAVLIERCQGLKGELQLQRRGREFEIIYNGLFIMATYNGASEKAAVREALQETATCFTAPLKVLIGGLGVGYSLREALDCPAVAGVTVIELEPAVIKWNQEVLAEVNGSALDDSRTMVINDDFRKVLQKKGRHHSGTLSGLFHVVMVDTDNGSSWLSLPENAEIYSEDGLSLILKCLYPGGAACFWAARREEEFEERLKKYFYRVEFRTVPEKTGHDGCYYIAVKALK